MLAFATFEKLLHTDVTLQPATKLISELKSNVRGWSATLGMKMEKEQCDELESVLRDLRLAQMPDNERIDLMTHVYHSVERVISQLHQHYIYETSVITDSQQTYVNQVKSLYFSTILVYQDVLNRQLALSNNSITSSSLRFKLTKVAVNSYNQVAVIALYRLSYIYLHLLMEQALTYQRSPDLYWREFNSLYKTALVKQWHDIDLHKELSKSSKVTIEEVYCQACLHSLLGLSSYRRQDILGIYKLLPFWANKVVMTQEATAKLRLFVDLNDENPPINLSPHSKVNPYEAERMCVFLDLSGFEHYLKHIAQQTSPAPKMSTQIRLAKIAWHTLQIKTGRREERHISYDTAVVVSGFNMIHYHMAGKKPLTKLIHHHKLPRVHLPKYDTTPKSGHTQNAFNVQVMDTSTTGCRFKWHINQDQKSQQQNRPAQSNDSKDNNQPSSLQVLSLFAIKIQPPDGHLQDIQTERNHNNPIENTQSNHYGMWQIGLIRWIETQDGVLEAGGRIIGYSVTACGLRLENKDQRSQVFVPALLLAGDKTLNTTTTLLVPHHHFRMGDKVVLRIGSDQTVVRLQSVLLSSDDFEQYEILRMN